MRVNTTGTNVRLTADDGAGHTSQSNPFDVQVGPVDHFAWSIVPSPQHEDTPFPVTITAQDVANNHTTNFTGTVALSASSSFGALQTNNTILGNVTHDDSSSGDWTLGYSFTPTNNLTVTHVRHYCGTKVSIWTDAGVLL